MKYILMNQNTEIMEIEYDVSSKKITDIYQIYNISAAPLCIYNANFNRSQNITKELNHWFRGRGIPSWRKDVEHLLINLGVESSEKLLDKAYGLSLSDQYWIKEAGNPISWEDINFFDHDFEYAGFLEAGLNSKRPRNKPTLYSPNNTTDGMLPKSWIIENGDRVLVKNTYTAYQQEPLNEWLASEISSRLGFDYCPYTVDVIEGKIVSKCKNFMTRNEELVPAYDIFYSEKKKNNVNDFEHYIAVLDLHNVPNARIQLENMVVLDYLIMNQDRHLKNFGIIRDVRTLEWTRVAPIFDNGQSMCCDSPAKDMNFYKGYGKLFTNTNKNFKTYLNLISDLNRFNMENLNSLTNDYQNILNMYKDVLDISNIRIESLVRGLETRIQEFEKERELIQFKKMKFSDRKKQIELMRSNKDSIKEVKQSIKQKNKDISI